MNDFNEINRRMKEHGMQLPSERPIIQIHNTREILKEFFEYFLSFEDAEFSWQPEYEKVAEWLSDNKGRGLLLFGDCGRGKSILTRYVIPAILLKYCNKVVSVYDIQQMNKNIDELLNKHIMALDDVGTEDVLFNYGNKRLAFAEIMDAVEKYNKLVIISTNLSGYDLEKQYGKRVLERIISTTKRIEFKGESLRK
jgi:DNA replication protein DnaC